MHAERCTVRNNDAFNSSSFRLDSSSSSSSSSSIWPNVLRGHVGLYKLSRLNSLPRSQIVNPCYEGKVYSWLEPTTGMLLSRAS